MTLFVTLSVSVSVSVPVSVSVSVSVTSVSIDLEQLTVVTEGYLLNDKMKHKMKPKMN